MELDELIEFAKKEHERLVTHFNTKDNPRTRYTMFAKLVEEVGELSEALLKSDSLQRPDKLKDKADLEQELADVILVSLILAKQLDVDIKKALEDKIKKIKERKY
jgi:NTP pyrophosphatase (non-canonical NTP hydrolase)